MRFFIIRGKTVWFCLLLIMGLTGGYYIYQSVGKTITTSNISGAKKEFTIITTEYKSKTEDGKIIEAYRWDPGTIVVEKGDRVVLNFYGVQGLFHPFEIKGLNVKGEVKKGRVTTVSFTADKEGTYEIMCTAHKDMEHEGPMVGYLIVD